MFKSGKNQRNAMVAILFIGSTTLLVGFQNCSPHASSMGMASGTIEDSSFTGGDMIAGGSGGSRVYDSDEIKNPSLQLAAEDGFIKTVNLQQQINPQLVANNLGEVWCPETLIGYRDNGAGGWESYALVDHPEMKTGFGYTHKLHTRKYDINASPTSGLTSSHVVYVPTARNSQYMGSTKVTYTCGSDGKWKQGKKEVLSLQSNGCSKITVPASTFQLGSATMKLPQVQSVHARDKNGDIIGCYAQGNPDIVRNTDLYASTYGTFQKVAVGGTCLGSEVALKVGDSCKDEISGRDGKIAGYLLGSQVTFWTGTKFYSKLFPHDIASCFCQ